ncbi:MAG: hypothetical protein IKP63_04150 [Paludibacteraceae bacterium]|nr:hypothetical protein [Paludibacteraceae bacterium]
MGDAAKAISQYEAALSRAKKAEQRREGLDEESTEWQELTKQIDAASAEMEVASKNIEKAEKRVGEALKDATTLNSVEYFKKTAGELKELISSGGDYTDALKTFAEEEKIAIAAQEEYNKIVEEGGVTAKTTVEDVSNLSEALGWDAQSILYNWERIGPLMEQLGMDMEAVRASLQKEIFLSLVGTSTADFSAIQEGLMSVENMAQSTIDALTATGQFEVIRKWMEENAEYQTFDPATGEIITTRAETSGWVDVIVPKGGSVPTKPSGSGTGGGGGGGGGGNKTKETSAAMKALDRMSRIQKLQENRRSLYSAQAGLYEQSGELQGVIAYNEKEIEVIEEQNETLEDNIKELEEWIAKKKEEMASLDQSSEEYTTAKEELEKLEDTHEEYTLALINNKKEVLSLRDAIKQLNNEIRDMQIEVYEEVVAALEARDEAEQERLEGTIAVQKSILEVMQEQEERQNSMLQGRIALENAILEKIMAQKEATDETQEARRNFEETILGIIEEEKALQDSMNQARINAEEDILSTIQEMKDLHDRMLNGRIDMENTILSILKEQVATQQKLLSATITVENKISSVLQAQLNRQKSMLQGRIGAENAVFALVKERYETEKSAALEAANAAKEGNQAQIEALQKQKQLLDEQLQLRKKQAEEQDKAVELAELEAKYARISADPTRMKEALEIRKQIDDLRDEMAWETAQKEIDAQKKAIDDQISALQGSDGGVAQINAYYEELFKHPTKLLTEVDEILKGTDDEIIEWLKANSEDYTWASEANKKKMVEDWKNTLREMRGETIDFRDEVTEIMQLSDEEIIAWLKENDEEYLLASDNKRKQLLEGWEQMMRDMHGQEISYAEEVARILGGSQEEVLNWLRTNDSNYANASPAEREKMVEDWKASLDDMYGVTKTYWREIDLILSGSEEDFISYMTQHSLQYADASKTSQEEMVKSWRQTYKDMKGEATTYWDEIDRLANGGYDAYIEELKRRSTSYATGSDGEKAQMLKEWTDIWDQMHGITQTYWEKVNEVIGGGLDNFIEFMKENNAEYAKASDSDKASTVMGWTDMWREMEGSSKDYRDEVAAVMAQGHDAYIGYMTSMSKEYADATEEEKKTMLKSYEDMWDQMTGKQKSYEDEANAIIAQGQEAIISTLTEYTTKYQDVGKLQSEAYIDEWKDKLEKLKKALQDVAINTDVFDYTQPDAVSESASANSSANASSTEENKLYWRAEANWQRTFESRREALDYKNTKISELEAKLAASPKDENILSKLETWRNTPILYYARGGIADFTGPAWLDGSKRNPERILSPRQTELFDILVSSLEDLSVHVPSFPSFDWAREGSTDGGFSFGDIVINVAHLDSDTDYDDMAERVLDSVMQKINRGSVVGGIRFSK